MKIIDLKFIPLSEVDIKDGDLFFLKNVNNPTKLQACEYIEDIDDFDGPFYRRLADNKKFPLSPFAQICPL